MDASSPPGSALSEGAQDALTTELQDDIQVDLAILKSLQEVRPSADIAQQIEATKARIRGSQKQLRNLQTLGSVSGANHGTDSEASSSGEAVMTPSSSERSSRMPSPTRIPFQPSDGTSRKRTFSKVSDVKVEAPRDAKSQKQSLTSPPTYRDQPPTLPSHPFSDDLDSIIDLTGIDDEASFLRWQEERMAQFNQQRNDAELARDLQERSDPHYSPIVAPFQSTHTNAFDRILSRPVPTLQQSLAVPGLSTGRDAYSPANPAQHGTLHHAGGTSQIQPAYPAPFPAPARERYHVPGSYGNNLYNENDFHFGPPQRQPGVRVVPQVLTNGSSSVRSLPPLPEQVLPSHGFHRSSAAEQARIAAFRRHDPSQEVIDLEQDFAPIASTSRAGFITGGLYSGLQNAAESLADLARRTTGIDWRAGTDRYGASLPPRWAEVMQYNNEAEQRSTNEDLENLLKTISESQEFTEKEKADTPEQMKCTLYNHQLIALKWMQDIESKALEGKGYKGGLLADDMGLGKTVSTLALMVTRPSSDKVKTNLIVGPVALIKQWQTEIKRKLHSRDSLSVFLLHGASKRNTDYEQLRMFDVVLTTYGTIAQEWKKFHDYVQAHPEENVENNRELHKRCPLMHPKSVFYRVILDEAQYIKNKSAQCSRGAVQINAKLRWCLSGTPMQNGVDELYSLFNFLRIRPYDSYPHFRQAFGSLSAKTYSRSDSHREVAMTRLRKLLGAVMLRRLKSSMIDGKPIVQLPDKIEMKDLVEFSPDESDYYRALEEKSQVTFNKYLRRGTVGKNYANILTLLLRLRQACCHPHLNMDVEPAANAGDTDALANSMSEEVIARIKEIEAFECPLCYDAVPDPALVLPCGHDCCSDCLARHLDTAIQRANDNGEDARGSAPCFLCRQPISPQNYIHYSAFKKVHMPDPVSTVSPAGAEVTDDSSDESEDDTGSDWDDEDVEKVDKNGNLKGFIVDNDDDGGDGDSETVEGTEPAGPVNKKPKGAKKRSASKSGKKKDKKGKAKAEEVKPEMLKELRVQAGKNMEFRRKYMRYLKANWQDSAKVTKCMELLAGIRETGEKTIIFSQWTALLDLFEVAVRKDLGLKYRRYDGSMSTSQREETVRTFTEDARTTVLLVSLKAGNAGLNLTAASNIIICDPFWNPYLEMQAVDRAHRIGQTREVKVHRILIEGTVEDRILTMQEQKRALVDGALDEGKGAGNGRLTEGELAYLFGVPHR